MNDSTMSTQYLPAERASSGEVRKLADFFSSQAPLKEFADALPKPVVALNRHRQIIFANGALLDLTGKERQEEVYGLRPGEALGCIHSDKTPGGCGTTEFCRTCGAARAIAAALDGKKEVQECRITTHNGESLDLRAWACPWMGGGEFVSFVIEDISHEKRRRILERIFFHDVLNTAGGVKGLADLLSKESDPRKARDLANLIQSSAHALIEEINAQKTLAAAETGDLTVQLERVWTDDLLHEVMDLYRNHILARDRRIVLHPSTDCVELTTDPVLVRRVLGNMAKNALEASFPGQTVTLGAGQQGDTVDLWVHNPGVMPRDSQLQVFQRSFSTKGNGRGLGTYSIRILTERYLRGRASFTSTEAEGTTFRISLPTQLGQHLARFG